MELHTPGRLSDHSDPHHQPLRGPGSHLDLLRQRLPKHRQGVVASRREGTRQRREDTLAPVKDRFWFAMDRAAGRFDRCSQLLGDHLVAETDPQNRDSTAVMLYRAGRQCGPLWSPWPGREDQAIGVQLAQLRETQPIRQPHRDARSRPRERLDQVVGEGIVVIDHHHVGSTTFDTPFAASVAGDGGWIGQRIVHTDDSTSLRWTLVADLMSPVGPFPPIVFVHVLS